MFSISLLVFSFSLKTIYVGRQEKELVYSSGGHFIFYSNSQSFPSITPFICDSFGYSTRDAGRSEPHFGRGRNHWSNRSGHLDRPREIATPAVPGQRRRVTLDARDSCRSIKHENVTTQFTFQIAKLFGGDTCMTDRSIAYGETCFIRTFIWCAEDTWCRFGV